MSFFDFNDITIGEFKIGCMLLEGVFNAIIARY